MDYVCGIGGCPYHTKKFNHVKRHRASLHNIGVKYHKCEVKGCSYKSKRTDDLKRHEAMIHGVGVLPLYYCGENGCKYVAKQSSHVKEHKSFAHNIGVMLQPCKVKGCRYSAKKSGDLKIHKALVHGIGTKFYDCGISGCKFMAKKEGNIVQHRKKVHSFIAKTNKQNKRLRREWKVGVRVKLTFSGGSKGGNVEKIGTITSVDSKNEKCCYELDERIPNCGVDRGIFDWNSPHVVFVEEVKELAKSPTAKQKPSSKKVAADKNPRKRSRSSSNNEAAKKRRKNSAPKQTTTTPAPKENKKNRKKKKNASPPPSPPQPPPKPPKRREIKTSPKKLTRAKKNAVNDLVDKFSNAVDSDRPSVVSWDTNPRFDVHMSGLVQTFLQNGSLSDPQLNIKFFKSDAHADYPMYLKGDWLIPFYTGRLGKKLFGVNELSLINAMAKSNQGVISTSLDPYLIAGWRSKYPYSDISFKYKKIDSLPGIQDNIIIDQLRGVGTKAQKKKHNLTISDVHEASFKYGKDGTTFEYYYFQAKTACSHAIPAFWIPKMYLRDKENPVDQNVIEKVDIPALNAKLDAWSSLTKSERTAVKDQNAGRYMTGETAQTGVVDIFRIVYALCGVYRDEVYFELGAGVGEAGGIWNLLCLALATKKKPASRGQFDTYKKDLFRREEKLEVYKVWKNGEKGVTPEEPEESVETGHFANAKPFIFTDLLYVLDGNPENNNDENGLQHSPVTCFVRGKPRGTELGKHVTAKLKNHKCGVETCLETFTSQAEVKKHRFEAHEIAAKTRRKPSRHKIGEGCRFGK